MTADRDHRTQRVRRRARAFTLMELMTVFVVLGVLFLVGAFAYSMIVEHSKKTAARAAAVSFAKSVQGASANHSTTVASLDPTISRSVADDDAFATGARVAWAPSAGADGSMSAEVTKYGYCTPVTFPPSTGGAGVLGQTVSANECPTESVSGPPGSSTGAGLAPTDAATLSAAAYGSHSCMTTGAGAAHCWGWNFNGQLGTGDGTNRSTATPVTGGHLFAKVGAGQIHTCGLTTAGDAYCWGDNSAGQLGTGNTTSSRVPVRTTGDVKFNRLYVGTNTNCALTSTGEAHCWGAIFGRPDENGFTTRVMTTPTPTAAGHQFTNLTVGTRQICGVALTGDALCWGQNNIGQLGIGPIAAVDDPTLVSGGHKFATMSAGDLSTCGLTAAGDAFCWGNNGPGPLLRVPDAVPGGHKFASVSVGADFACGVTLTGQGLCWGVNQYAQLGNGATGTARVTTPTPVSGGHNFATMTSGRLHACGLTTMRDVLCWGENSLGGLGNGDQGGATQVAPVAATTTWKS